MALTEPFETPQGATATYRRVLRVEMDFITGDSIAWVACYPNEAARRAGKGPLWVEYIPLAPGVAPDPRPAVYGLLEAQPAPPPIPPEEAPDVPF